MLSATVTNPQHRRFIRNHTSGILNRMPEAEPYLDGARVAVNIYPHTRVYIYILPWSRGWSVFATDSEHVESHSWREVPDVYKGLQESIPCPRNIIGPWNVPVHKITEAATKLLFILKRLDDARRARAAKKFWYWHREILSRTDNQSVPTAC